MSAAGVENYESLAPLVEQSAQIRRVKERLSTLGEQIIMLGEGMTLDALISDSEGADSATLKSRVDDLQDECASLSAEIECLATKLATDTVAFQALDDGPDAATAAADMELARTDMALCAESCLRKRAAATLRLGD